MFDTVQCLTMIDGRPFEHNLFKLISQCFPLLKELHVVNYRSQKKKQHSSILIIFPHLILLNLVKAHVNYAKQLLYDKNSHLPSLLDLCIEYKSLTMITKNFTNDAICRNCAKIKKLHANSFFRSTNFHKYFPLL
jgi:predicted transcriptional regulator